MTVPSQYKGFSKLPEEVQQKMSPELAKKYNMGGDVLQRPLFRQMGGPAEAMPPAPMNGREQTTTCMLTTHAAVARARGPQPGLHRFMNALQRSLARH